MVRMLVGLSGPAGFFDVGDIYECDEAEAARLIGARFALPAHAIETTSVAVAAERRDVPVYDMTAPRAPGQPAPRVRKKKG